MTLGGIKQENPEFYDNCIILCQIYRLPSNDDMKIADLIGMLSKSRVRHAIKTKANF
ncbi:hypothetical protein SAMN05660297_02257 [Natronincola peptidivorans]|uniref:Uncharacterized protein n=1 Tax=Natronincola peptidivorans TaxID=426128 RepID=A0A1I0E1K7_9FIRM|nr:hypothetical protein SAMN05660297_02257 [Natronincola peptidivorans]